MADMVNLRRARKTQERMRRLAESAEARARHGRSKSERALAAKEQESAQARLDGHKLVSDKAKNVHD